MTDNGARALAERLADTPHGTPFHDSLGRLVGWAALTESEKDHFEREAAAILANGAVFLPDAAETEAEHERQSAAGTHLFDEGCRYCCAAELDRLRAALREVLDRIDYINGSDAREVLQRARAALQPEGSAGT